MNRTNRLSIYIVATYSFATALALTLASPRAAHGQIAPAAPEPATSADTQDVIPAPFAPAPSAPAPSAPAPSAEIPIQENTLAQCGDKTDNDNDGYVDCEDQDCSIFVICADNSKAVAPVTAEAASQQTKSVSITDDSQEPLTRTFSIGVVPGLSTDSAAEGEVLNHFSLNLIGWQDHLQGAEFSILGAIRKGTVRGYQGSSLFNVVAGDLAGVQESGLVNFTAGEVIGAQVAGLFNVAGESSRALQLGGLGNFTGGDFSGLQGAGLVNVATENVRGFQGAGLANITGGAIHGFQGAGLVNVAGTGGTGVQVSGIANVATGDFTGLQLSLVNFGTSVKGAQVGLINIATESMKGASIGLVNYAGDGMLAPTVWASSASMVNLGLKMGTQNVYSLIGAGVHPFGGDSRTSVAVGLGIHGDLTKRLWLEFDLVHNRLFDRNTDFDSYDVDFIEQARFNLGFRLADEFSLYAGPSLDVLVSEIRDEIGFATFYTHNDRSSDTDVSVSLGLTAGIQWQPRIHNLNRPR